MLGEVEHLSGEVVVQAPRAVLAKQVHLVACSLDGFDKISGVIVDGPEVTLNGRVNSREEKRLAEDLADVRGVTHIQNNLRIGRRGFWR